DRSHDVPRECWICPRPCAGAARILSAGASVKPASAAFSCYLREAEGIVKSRGRRSGRRLPHPLDLLERAALGFGHGLVDPEPADEAEEAKQPEGGGNPDRADQREEELADQECPAPGGATRPWPPSRPPRSAPSSKGWRPSNVSPDRKRLRAGRSL